MPATQATANWREVEPFDWTGHPLYRVQFWALRSRAAAEDLARRYALSRAVRYSEKYQKRIRQAYLSGWDGESDKYSTNFERPLSLAHHAGRKDRREIETEVGS